MFPWLKHNTSLVAQDTIRDLKSCRRFIFEGEEPCFNRLVMKGGLY